jgi:hypothetical protein
MTKDEIKIIEKRIKDFIKTLDQYNNEELVYYYKCALIKLVYIPFDKVFLLKAHL